MTKEQNGSIALERFQPLQLVMNTPKGRGVFAGELIPAGTIIDISPVLILDPGENKAHIEHTSLYHYTYNWPLASSSDRPNTTQAVVFGLGSMFNHSKEDQNVGWRRDLAKEVIIYRSLREIQVGEELCISYGDRLTFADADSGTMQVTEEEDGAELLAKIELDAS